MDMTAAIIVLLAVALIVLILYFNKGLGADVNKDGKVDMEDVKQAVKNVEKGVKATVAKKRGRKPSTTKKKK